MVTWYLDSSKCTRQRMPRPVLLHSNAGEWIPHILHRWQDSLDKSLPISLYVVHPHPIDGPSDVSAHVLLVQRPNELWWAALITSKAHDADPWAHETMAAMLNQEVTPNDIAFIAGKWQLVDGIPVFPAHRVRHSALTLASEQLFPVRNGFSFEITTLPDDQVFPEGLSLIQKDSRWCVP